MIEKYRMTLIKMLVPTPADARALLNVIETAEADGLLDFSFSVKMKREMLRDEAWQELNQ